MALSKEQMILDMRNAQVVVLNVLPKADYDRLRIKGSRSHPLTADLEVFSRTVEERYGKEKLFILYGDQFSHLESYFATRALLERSLKAQNYPGGIQEWHKAGYPVEGTGVPAPSGGIHEIH